MIAFGGKIWRSKNLLAAPLQPRWSLRVPDLCFFCPLYSCISPWSLSRMPELDLEPWGDTSADSSLHFDNAVLRCRSGVL